MNPRIVKNRFTGRRSVCLGRNMYYWWLLDMQAADPAQDWYVPRFLLRLLWRVEETYEAKWKALGEL